LHNTFGFRQGKATFEWFKSNNRRPFIISRSTNIGSGKYNSHLLGYMTGDWNSLKLTITGILNFNMFGIPLVGSDSCGSVEEYNYELCYRWTQLSAWSPFSRNSNSGRGLAQEPFLFDGKFKKMFKQSIFTK